jgi:hypothetical protein
MENEKYLNKLQKEKKEGKEKVSKRKRVMEETKREVGISSGGMVTLKT